MNSVLILFLISTLSINSIASTICHLRSSLKTPDDATKAEFLCGKGKNNFTAICDLTVDPIEFGKGWIAVKKAKWSQHKERAGIEGKFGFIICRKIN